MGANGLCGVITRAGTPCRRVAPGPYGVCNKHERGHHAELMRAYEAGHQDGWTTGFEAGRRKGRLDLEWENVRDAARRKALGPALRPAVPTTGDDEL